MAKRMFQRASTAVPERATRPVPLVRPRPPGCSRVGLRSLAFDPRPIKERQVHAAVGAIAKRQSRLQDPEEQASDVHI